MAKGNSKKSDSGAATVGTGASKLLYKKEQRKAQSQKDRATAQAVPGWATSAKRATANDFRCGQCGNPSAAIRRNESRNCNRCAERHGAGRKRITSSTVPANNNAAPTSAPIPVLTTVFEKVVTPQ